MTGARAPRRDGPRGNHPPPPPRKLRRAGPERSSSLDASDMATVSRGFGLVARLSPTPVAPGRVGAAGRDLGLRPGPGGPLDPARGSRLGRYDPGPLRAGDPRQRDRGDRILPGLLVSPPAP